MTDKVAPPKGLAVALTKSLLEDSDDLQESSQVEHYWVDNEAYLGRNQLRHKLIQAVRSVTPPTRPKRVISRHIARSASVQSLDMESAQLPNMPDSEERMEGDLARVITNYYGPQLKPDGAQSDQIFGFDSTGVDSHSAGDEVDGDDDAVNSGMDIFLDVGSAGVKTDTQAHHLYSEDGSDETAVRHLVETTQTSIHTTITRAASDDPVTDEDEDDATKQASESHSVSALRDAAKEALRVAYMTGNARDLKKANVAFDKATKAAEQARTAKRNARVIHLQRSGDKAQLAILMERKNLERRVENRLEAEHVASLQDDAKIAKKKAHAAKLNAAKELQHWVENRAVLLS